MGLPDGSPRVLRARYGWPAYVALITVMGCLVAAGCRPGAESVPEVLVDWRLTPHPPVVGPATFFFTLADTAGGPVTGATVQVEGNMAHAGMKPVLSSATEVAPGQYQASLAFTMRGDWVVSIEAVLADGRTLRRQVAINAVRAE